MNRPVQLLAIVALTAGCTASQQEKFSSMSPTTVGAATGAVIGGGIGAIVGAQTGSTGGGLAFGGLAGAATGGIIGRQFEKQNEAVAQQKERSARQEQLMAANRRNLTQLQRAKDDPATGPTVRDISAFNRPSVPASMGSYRGSPRAKSFAGMSADDGLSRASFASPAVSAPTKQAIKSVSTPPKIRAEEDILPPTTSEKGKTMSVAPQESAPTLSAPTNGLPPARTAKPAPEMPIVSESELGDSEVEVEEPQAAAQKPVEQAAVKNETRDTSSKPAKATGEKTAAAAPKSGECAKAEEEAGRARSASSEADQLFYFRRALRLCSQEPKYHLEIGKVYASIGRIDDAEAEYRQVLELDPKNAEAKSQLQKLSTPQ